MDWKNSVKKIREEENKTAEREEKERKTWEGGVERAKKILPQAQEVLNFFVRETGLLLAYWPFDAPPLDASFETEWSGNSLHIDAYFKQENGDRFLVLTVELHPFCPACAKEIIGGDYVLVRSRFLPGKYPVYKTHFDAGDYGKRYRHPNPSENEFAKISFKEFTKEKLAEMISDILAEYVRFKEKEKTGDR